ncbi:hypothetical protein CHGG_07546 [Chaetomium globosum CBS 148.51]|uniref:Uncharacterized protein n=1 Tax=Chaetomium globosum (strain ATCC 6205 / CBS 148.51 / DSM 1962 / NBRC 6347 / NRRL 1970) TaxID=306901 RepID=Q2GWV8_CHAGB|nr:uncharacterized protein CHGG_07546 [Chaetomium globosum CBS 148.51]EAQ86293.1 hypothetical protein CHGG_07546 [Chaetomium globosum CBS 148.51]
MAQRTQEDAGDMGPWITFNAPEHDPAWAFKQAMDKLEQRKDHFRQFMKRFLAKYNDRGAWKVTFDESTTWPQVLEEATQAFDDYTKRGRSWRHPFRSTQRLFGSVACRIKFLVVLLPDGDFTGALCGGLCLIYNAATRRREIQELIIRTLDSLSQHVEGTKSFLMMYAWDEDVRQKTEDLYIAILETIEALTEWLYRSSLHAVHHNVLTVGKRVEQMSEHITALRFEALSVLEKQFHGMSKGVEWQIHRLEERQRNFHLQTLQAIPHPNTTTTFLNPYLPPTPPQPTLTIPSLLTPLNLPTNPTTTPPNTTTTNTINTPYPLTKDQNLTLLLSRATQQQQQSTLHFATASHQFQTWLRSLSSCVLTIHGMDVTPPTSSMAPGVLGGVVVPVTIHFCALLLGGLARLADGDGGGGVYPVGFYCRLHGGGGHGGGGGGGSEEGFDGPAGMMRFLIAQVVLLLATRRAELGVDLSHVGVAEAEALRRRDLDALCLVFDGLVKQIGVGVVFGPGR